MKQPKRFTLMGWVVGVVALTGSCPAAELDRFFDAHVHYNETVWEVLSPKQAVDTLRANGVQRCLVSSTPGHGAMRLHRADPELVVPLLRPYRNQTDRLSWFTDPSIVDYVKQELAKHPYAGIGEFHMFADQARTPVVEEIARLAERRGLLLFAHTDAAGIEALFRHAPSVRILWAHAGFDHPVDDIRRMLSIYPELYIELSFRLDIASDGVMHPDWRDAFIKYSDRFLIGSDTYIPARWRVHSELIEEDRAWLSLLPAKTARKLAVDNGMRLFPQ